MAAKKQMSYRVLVGLTYPSAGGDKRAEPGEVVDDLPAKSLPWLLEQGAVEEVNVDADASD